MGSLLFSKKDTGFHIEGFPDAAKVIKLSGKLSDQLAAYALHHSDLRKALLILESINGIDPSSHVVREALWHQAIVTYIKCFRFSESRMQLDEKKIYKGDPPEAFDAFRYFVALRNKSIIHDVNSFTQCLPGAVLNERGHLPKIAKIVCMGFKGSVLGQEGYSNLHLLIRKALKWVEAKFDDVCDRITADLDAEEYDNLLNRDAITYSKPTLTDIDKARVKP